MNIPKSFIPGIEKGFMEVCDNGESHLYHTYVPGHEGKKAFLLGVWVHVQYIHDLPCELIHVHVYMYTCTYIYK